ncbi:MAG: mandelate racemase/muconate lactonizing enzyme family protein [Chloroflexi bacterium]|nr:mandelate racemase/muconate lactonizing enzyme family protein [Chloroflexota bacterium]
MKITSVETFHVQHQLPKAIGPSTYFYDYRDALLVKISTDEGLVGWGETAPMAGTRGIIEKELAPRLIGQNPLEHRRLWRQLWGPNFGNGLAVGAVDIALHDIWGKALNLPIAELYGGRLRERVPAYGSALSYTRGVDAEKQYPADAIALVEQGFRSIKLRIGGLPLKQDYKVARAVREAVGPDIQLSADGNGAYSLGTAIQMGRMLEELEYSWFEEPLPQPNYAGYEVLTEKLDIAIAAGEALQSRGEFKEVIERRAMDIVQPDPCLCGGIRECLFIGEMARLWSIQCVPHCWSGTIVIAAVMHVLALLPDASWARTTETPLLELDVVENPFRDKIVTNPFRLQDGFVAVPTGPGLGIEVDEEALMHYVI